MDITGTKYNSVNTKKGVEKLSVVLIFARRLRVRIYINRDQIQQ